MDLARICWKPGNISRRHSRAGLSLTPAEVPPKTVSYSTCGMVPCLFAFLWLRGPAAVHSHCQLLGCPRGLRAILGPSHEIQQHSEEQNGPKRTEGTESLSFRLALWPSYWVPLTVGVWQEEPGTQSQKGPVFQTSSAMHCMTLIACEDSPRCPLFNCEIRQQVLAHLPSGHLFCQLE